MLPKLSVLDTLVCAGFRSGKLYMYNVGSITAHVRCDTLEPTGRQALFVAVCFSGGLVFFALSLRGWWFSLAFVFGGYCYHCCDQCIVRYGGEVMHGFSSSSSSTQSEFFHHHRGVDELCVCILRWIRCSLLLFSYCSVRWMFVDKYDKYDERCCRG